MFSDGHRSYGQINFSSGSGTYKFAGKPVSATTGLYYDYHRWYDPSIGRFISPDPKHGRISNPQSVNPYVYVTNIPTLLIDPTGEDQGIHDHTACVRNNTSCNGPDPLFIAVSNFISNNVVTPLVNNVVKPLVNNVVVPLVKKVIIPYLKDEYNALVATYNTLSNVGSQMWNGYQSFTNTIRNEQQSLYRSVNQDLQGFAHDITHLRITDVNRFFTGLVECAVMTGIIAVAWELLPEVAIAAGTIDLATYGTAAIGLGGIGYLEFGHALYEAGSGIVELGTGCVGNTLGTLSTS